MRRFIVAGLAALLALTWAQASLALPPAAQRVVLASHDFPPIAGAYGFKKANNAVLLAALHATKAGTADTIIAYIGDSTVQGQNSTGAQNTNSATNSASKQLADLLQAAGIPTSVDGWWGSVDGSSPTWANFLAANPKFTSTGTGMGFQFTSVAGEPITSSDTTSTFTYTTSKSANKVDVYYLGVSGSGDFVFSVDGGSESAAVHTTQASRGMYRVTIDLGTHATHAVKYRFSGGGTVWMIGQHYYDTTTHRVIVQNQGAGGWRASDWVDTSNPESPGNQYFNTGAHLAIDEAGLVNSRNAVSSATAQPDVQTMISNYKANNTTVWLVNPEPYLDDPINASYVAMLAGLSNANKVTFVDTMFPNYSTATLWTAAGFGDGTVHPLGVGYGYIASRLSALIQAAWSASSFCFLAIPARRRRPANDNHLTQAEAA